LNLVVGSNNYTFSLTNNSLVGLRDKINSLGAGVNASILTTSGGNYLALSANSTGAQRLQLFDDPAGADTNLLTSTNQGTDAVFQLNGINVRQAGNIVNSVVPGVTLDIVGATSSPVTVSLQSDPTQLSSALQNFVDNYNAVRSQLIAQTGPNGGLLSGNSVVEQLQAQLRQIASYRTSSGSIRSLADLGVEFSTTGQASLNQTTLDSLSSTQISDAFQYLGSTTSGLGGFAQSLNQFTDPITGLIKAETDGLDTTDKNIQLQIATLTDRGNRYQTALAAQLAKADTQLSELQAQQQTITASLQGLSLVLYGKSPNQ
jgi:flagellar hook-associated protein 2